AYVMLFLVATGESSAFLGLVVPGETFAILAGVLAQRGSLSVQWLIVAAIIGAILGDSIGFAIGRYFDRHRDAKLLRKLWTPEREKRVGKWFDAHGGVTIFIGRFIGFLRPLGPFFAGATGMRFHTFIAFDAPAGLLWGTGSVLLGYFVGTAADTALHSIGRWATIGIGAAVIVGYIIYRIRKKRTITR
ncbi:MAG: DedA family protein, partial [Actinomycetota bacterium]